MSINKSKYVSELLEEIAFFLELKDENPFRIRVYKYAAYHVARMKVDIQSCDTLIKQNLEGLALGSSMLQTIEELFKTGKNGTLVKLRLEFPASLRELACIRGIGIKKIKLFYEQHAITNIQELELACMDGRLDALPGIGKKTIATILQGLNFYKQSQGWILYKDARSIADVMLEVLRPYVIRSAVAGAVRRCHDIVNCLNIVISIKENNKPDVMEALHSFSPIKTTVSINEEQISCELSGGITAKITTVPDALFSIALHQSTGSNDYLQAFYDQAITCGKKMRNEGTLTLFDGEDSHCKEKDIFSSLHLPYIPPELRENHEIIDWVREGNSPSLVQESDYKGVLHCHTSATDGTNTIKELINHAKANNHAYLGITDHSKSSHQANGMTEDRLIAQITSIRHFQRQMDGELTLFSGIECDILRDGTLDYTNDILDQLDYVIISVHSNFGQSKQEMTKRVVRAIEHPASRILAHPTGRLLLRREAYAIDLKKIMDAARANDVAIELNCNPLRMDMAWSFWRQAKEKGVRCSINPDAHSLDHFLFLEHGISAARKGWLSTKEVINCWSIEKLYKFFRKS